MSRDCDLDYEESLRQEGSFRCQNPQVEARILSKATLGIAATNLPEFQKKRGNIALSPAIYAPIKALISDTRPEHL
jgi:hypothetical protein